jgi:formylglycine-generating enzyme required for sulfatase activity
MQTIFLSYSHFDRPLCERIVRYLSSHLTCTITESIESGISLSGVTGSLFYDQHLTTGDSWIRVLGQKIQESPIFILLLSEHSITSPWVRQEIELALTLAQKDPNRQIIPIQLESCDAASLSPFLLTYHMIQLSSSCLDTEFHAAMERTIRIIQGEQNREYSLAPNIQRIQNLSTQLVEGIQQHHWRDAANTGELLLRLTPRNPAVASYLAQAYTMLKKTSEALRILDDMISMNPHQSTLWQQKASVYMQITPPDISHANQCWDTARAYADSLSLKLAILSEQHNALVAAERWNETIEVCETALELDPSIEWFIAKINALDILKRYPEALREIRDILQKNICTNTEILLSLWLKRAIYAHECDPKSYKTEIEEALIQAKKINPQHSRIEDTEQHIYFRQPVLPTWLRNKGYMLLTGSQNQEYILPPTVTVPGGIFLMGANPLDSAATPLEKPHHPINLPTYSIMSYPVTVAEYACAIRAGIVLAPEPEKHWNGYVFTWQVQEQQPEHPVVCITWYEAISYAQWLSLMTGKIWRLPTEAEWEKAARGTDGRIYPNGNTWIPNRFNTKELGTNWTLPIGSFENASFYGVYDMAGNVYDKTSSRDLPYPYDPSQSENHQGMQEDDLLVVKGGAWFYARDDARCSRRGNYPRTYRSYNQGFRLVTER